MNVINVQTFCYGVKHTANPTLHRKVKYCPFYFA